MTVVDQCSDQGRRVCFIHRSRATIVRYRPHHYCYGWPILRRIPAMLDTTLCPELPPGR